MGKEVASPKGLESEGNVEDLRVRGLGAAIGWAGHGKHRCSVLATVFKGAAGSG